MSTGKLHSYQTLGTLDGPGVRFLVFMQGCSLRCAYCHNPDTWGEGGFTASPEQVLERCLRYKSYFGKQGGITVSGGEALLQPDFVREVFTLCHENGIHTVLDTSGCRLDAPVQALLAVTDMVLLDVKMTTEELYQRYTGGSLAQTIHFLEELERRGIDTWIRQVIVEGINDDEENIQRLGALLKGKTCVKRVELLPFQKLCMEKYQELGIPFPLEHYPQTSAETIDRLTKLLKSKK